jgi:Antitoxin VbhA
MMSLRSVHLRKEVIIATWQQRYAHVLEGLTESQRSRVVESIHSDYLEGYEPTEEDVRDMVRLELGEITSLEAIAAGLSRRGLVARRGATANGRG